MIPTLQIGGLGRSRKATGGAYTAMNPSDKGANVTLSGGNLIVGASVSSAGIVRSVQTLSGKRYFEAVFTAGGVGTATIAAGVANSSHVLTASLGYSNANGWALWGTGTGARHNGVTAVAASVGIGSVIGIAVDITLGRMWISVDGTWMASGDPATNTNPIWTNLAGTLYAAACPWTSAAIITMRFDPATFATPAPSGFSPITA